MKRPLNHNIILEPILVGTMGVNAYVVGDPVSKEAALIDPGADYSKIKRIIDKNLLKLKYVVNTHGHGDHIGGDDKFGVPILIHRLDADFLGSPAKNLSAYFGFSLQVSKPDRFLEEKDKIEIGRLSLEVLHTPGHTPGSICLKYDNILFSGDTLFYEGVGRTDFPHASEKDLFDSIKNKLFTLPEETRVYPGHGPPTTIAHEKKNNPFL